MLGISYWLAVLLGGLFVCLYLLIGGFRATVTTGVLQWVFIVAIVLIATFIAGDRPWAASTKGFLDLPVTFAFGFFAISFLVVVTSLDLWQLIFATKSVHEARRGLISSIPIYFVISAGLVILSTVVGANVPASELAGSLFSLSESVWNTEWLRALTLLFVLACIASTLDSQVYLFSSSFTSEFLVRNRRESDAGNAKLTRIVIFLAIALAALAAVFVKDIVTFLFGAVTLATVLLPLLALALLDDAEWTLSDDIFFAASVVLSSVAYIYLFSAGYFQNLLFTLIPSAVAVVLVLGWLLFSKFSSRRI